MLRKKILNTKYIVMYEAKKQIFKRFSFSVKIQTV